MTSRIVMADIRQLHDAIQQQRQDLFVQEKLLQLGVHSEAIANPFKKRPRPLTNAEIRQQVTANVQGFFNNAYGKSLSDADANTMVDLLQNLADVVAIDVERFKKTYNNGNVARFDYITDGIAKLSDKDNERRSAHFRDIVLLLRNIGFPKKAAIPEYNETCPWLETKYAQYNVKDTNLCAFYSKFRYITELARLEPVDFHILAQELFDVNELYVQFKSTRENFLDPSVQIEKDVKKQINVEAEFALTKSIFKKLFIDGLNSFLLKLRGKQLILSFYKSDAETLREK